MIREGKDPSLPNLLDQLVLDFKYPSNSELLSHVEMVNIFALLLQPEITKSFFCLPDLLKLVASNFTQICKSEGVDVTISQLKHVVDVCLGDIRRTMLLLQFWCQGKQQVTGWNLC